MDKYKLRDLWQGTKYLLGFILLGLFVLIFFSSKDTSSSNEPIFNWPKDMSLKVELRGSLDILDVDPFSEKSGSYPFYIELLASPRNATRHSLFNLIIKRATLYDKRQVLLIDFDQTSKDKLHYRIDSRLSEEEQNKILSLLKVDKNSFEILHDHSLLKEVIEIAVTNEGKLIELTLKPQVEKMLSENLNTNPFFSLIESLLMRPDQIPSLGPSLGKDQWVTEGYLVTPLKFAHKKLNDHSFQSIGHGSKQAADASISQEWKLDWERSNGNYIPSKVNLSFKMNQNERHFSSNSSRMLNLDVKIKMKEVMKESIIDMVNIDDELQ